MHVRSSQQSSNTNSKPCRCFVSGRELIAISQRDVSQHFPQLSEPGTLDSLEDSICAFHDDVMHGSTFPLPDYTYDVYVATNGAVRLVDVNAIGGATSPLLFTWLELPFGHHFGGPSPAAAAAATAPAAEAAAAAVASAAGTAGTAATAAGGFSASSSTADDCISAAVSSGAGSAGGSGIHASQMAPPVDFRTVTSPEGLQLGVRAAVGMPYDMLLLQEGGAAELIERLQQRQREEGAGSDDGEDD